MTIEQIAEWNLPTRPTKRTDSRSGKFKDKSSVEVDAIPTSQLRDLVEGAIHRHLDLDMLARTRRIEAEERRQLVQLATEFPTRRLRGRKQ